MVCQVKTSMLTLPVMPSNGIKKKDKKIPDRLVQCDDETQRAAIFLVTRGHLSKPGQVKHKEVNTKQSLNT